MNASSNTQSARTIETAVEINAPVDAVWKALTDADELIRWFPLQARSKPGPDGSIWISWDGDYDGEMGIKIWEPNQHLRVSWPWHEQEPEMSAGAAAAITADTASELTVDYYLEGRGGVTVLRLVHTGFGAGADWDAQYDGTCRGWDFELRGLKHYLENHRGIERRVANVAVNIDMPYEEAWDRLMGADGLAASGKIDGMKAGESYSIRLASGDEMEGTVQINNPPRDLALVVKNLNRSLFRLRLDKECQPDKKMAANMWLSTYGMPQSEVNAIQSRFKNLLEGLF